MRRKVAVTAGVVIAVLLVVLQASEPTPSEAYSGPCTNGTSISATSGRELLRPCEHTTAKCTSWTRAGTCDGYARYVKLCEVLPGRRMRADRGVQIPVAQEVRRTGVTRNADPAHLP